VRLRFDILQILGPNLGYSDTVSVIFRAKSVALLIFTTLFVICIMCYTCVIVRCHEFYRNNRSMNAVIFNKVKVIQRCPVRWNVRNASRLKNWHICKKKTFSDLSLVSNRFVRSVFSLFLPTHFQFFDLISTINKIDSVIGTNFPRSVSLSIISPF